MRNLKVKMSLKDKTRRSLHSMYQSKVKKMRIRMSQKPKKRKVCATSPKYHPT